MYEFFCLTFQVRKLLNKTTESKVDRYHFAILLTELQKGYCKGRKMQEKTKKKLEMAGAAAAPEREGNL